MLVLDDKNKCTGCAACEQKCPTNAITMVADEEGFFYPEINDKKCIHCNLCTKICPQENKDYMNNGPISFWGGVIKDKKILLDSSSGGAFTAICNSINKDAIIFGVTYDDKLKVHHIWCKNGKDIAIFRKSKYLQSDVRNTYSEVKKFLNGGNIVLFTGTSCQISGLYAFLGKKPENLYTVDLICHGVPSQKIFDAYISSLSKRKRVNISKFSFRDKSYFFGDWEIGTAYGDINKMKHQAWGEDFFMTGFLRGLFYRPSCYQCKYANSKIKRPADLTIGDFWGSEKISHRYNEKRGSSLIIVNSYRGEELLYKIKKTMDLTEINREQAVIENHNLIEPTKIDLKRDEFFSQLIIGTDFMTIMKKYRKQKSHSQKVRVIVTKIFPWIVELKRKKVRSQRKSRI